MPSRTTTGSAKAAASALASALATRSRSEVIRRAACSREPKGLAATSATHTVSFSSGTGASAGTAARTLEVCLNRAWSCFVEYLANPKSKLIQIHTGGLIVIDTFHALYTGTLITFDRTAGLIITRSLGASSGSEWLVIFLTGIFKVRFLGAC